MPKLALAVLTSAVLLSGASADPFKPSKADQLKLGKQAAAEIRQKERVLPASDPRVQLVRRVGRDLLSTFHDKDQPWEYSFDVIDSKEVNAFALPGGPIFFYTGLLDRMKYEDEVAAVMAHELIHVRREHWAYQQRDANKANIGFLLGGLFGVKRDTLRAGALLYTTMSELPFSRKHENESDAFGFETMVKAGYNPEGMVLMFETLKSASRGGKPPEFLSTHPDDGNRIKNTKARISAVKTSVPALRPLKLN
jgi:predicted Zn-dependent protease